MSYYYEKTSSYLTEHGVKSTLGAHVLSWSDDRKQEIGLFPASNVSYDYNPYTHTLSSVTWTKYTTDSDFFVANPSASEGEDNDYEFPGYVGQRSIVSLSDSAKVTTLVNAKKIVFNEVSERMMPLISTSSAVLYNALGIVDSAGPIASHMSSSDSDILEMAYHIDRKDQNYDSDFPPMSTDYLRSGPLMPSITSGQVLDFSSLPTSDPGVVGRLWRDSDVVKVSL